MKDFGDKIVILSPHLDDEVLGCGGVITHAVRDKMAEYITIVYFSDRHPNFFPHLVKRERDEVLALTGCNAREYVLASVNHYADGPITRFISLLEETIDSLTPSTLFVPFPSYNQDHRRIYEAAMTATRPHDHNFLVRNVLLYEQPETVQTYRMETKFSPNVFLGIDIERKLDLMKIYQTQIRGHRSLDSLHALAKMRGMQCGLPFAESFMLGRRIE